MCSVVWRLRAASALLAALTLLPATAQTDPAASAPVPAAAPPRTAGPEAFQGLPWGATEAEIQARFGERLKPLPCDAGARSVAARVGEVCETPHIARYDVAGVPFTLLFHLDSTERRLVRVTLTHAGEPAQGQGSDARWSEHHRVMRRLLSQRYGAPESTDVANDAGAFTAYARWRRGHTLIELNSLFVPRSGGAPAREQMQVSYLPVHHGEAGKL
jgi:hypothetical protein